MRLPPRHSARPISCWPTRNRPWRSPGPGCTRPPL